MKLQKLLTTGFFLVISKHSVATLVFEVGVDAFQINVLP